MHLFCYDIHLWWLCGVTVSCQTYDQEVVGLIPDRAAIK